MHAGHRVSMTQRRLAWDGRTLNSTGKLLVKYGHGELEVPLLSSQDHMPWDGVEDGAGCLFPHAGMQEKTTVLGTAR